MATKKRSPWIAGLLSLLAAGLGQTYNGELRKGAIFFVIALLISPVSLAFLVLTLPSRMYVVCVIVTILLLLTFRIYAIVEAILTAKNLGASYELKSFNRWYYYCLFLSFSAIMGDLAVGRSARNYIAQPYRMPSGTMLNTLEIGDHIYVDKLAYGIRNPFTGACIARCRLPARGDVIVFIFPEDRSKDFVKRVIGLPGETIAIRDKKVLINGKEIDDPRAHFGSQNQLAVTPPSLDNLSAKTLPKDCLFVMGDNRDRSYDSRFWGCVHLNDVKGRVRIIYWSWQSGIRWERIGQPVL